MNQHLVIHFSVVKNDRVYQLMLQPGCAYAEVQEILDLFKADFAEMQRLAEEKAKQDATDLGDLKPEEQPVAE